MRIVTSYDEFADEVEVIWDREQLLNMGLICSTSLVGIFVPSEMDDVIEFCEMNPQFHIVSVCLSGFIWNRFHPDGNAYHLAEGNPDSDLVLDFRIEREESLDELFSSKPRE